MVEEKFVCYECIQECQLEPKSRPLTENDPYQVAQKTKKQPKILLNDLMVDIDLPGVNERLDIKSD